MENNRLLGSTARPRRRAQRHKVSVWRCGECKAGARLKQIKRNGGQPVRFLERQFAFTLFLMFSFAIAVTAAPATKSASRSYESLRLIGWRLQSKIVLRGNVLGLDRLREIAGKIELQTDSKMAPEGNPTPLMQAVVSTLSELQSGHVEIRDGKMSLVGIAEPRKIEGLKKQVQQHASEKVKIAKLQIGSPEQPPFQWAAYRYNDDYGSDTIELNGWVIDETARAKLISIARSMSDDIIVIDRMKVELSSSSKINDAALAGTRSIKCTQRWVCLDQRKLDRFVWLVLEYQRFR